MDNQTTLYDTGKAELMFILLPESKMYKCVQSISPLDRSPVTLVIYEISNMPYVMEVRGHYDYIGDPFSLTEEQWENLLSTEITGGSQAIAKETGLLLCWKLEVYPFNPYEQDLVQIDEGFSGYSEEEKEAIYHHHELARSRTGKWVLIAKMKNQ